MSKQRFIGKVAVITGATTGIGRAIAKRYAREGAKLVLCDRRGSNSKLLVEEIKQGGGTVRFVETDMSCQDEVKHMIDIAKASYGPVDILVNIPTTRLENKFFRDLSEADWNQLMEHDALGAMYTMWEVLPAMRARGNGTVINITSLYASKPEIRTAFYAYFMAGMNMMTKCLSVEYAPHGVRVNAIAPGVMETELPDNAEDYLQDMMGLDAMKRAGKPEEIADAAAWLASDEASYVAGAIIPIDGGVVSTMRDLETWEIKSAN